MRLRKGLSASVNCEWEWKPTNFGVKFSTIQLFEYTRWPETREEKKSDGKQQQPNLQTLYDYACSRFLGAILLNCFRFFLRRLDKCERVKFAAQLRGHLMWPPKKRRDFNPNSDVFVCKVHSWKEINFKLHMCGESRAVARLYNEWAQGERAKGHRWRVTDVEKAKPIDTSREDICPNFFVQILIRMRAFNC